MPISQKHDFFIQWHLTERCNLRCSHCYQTGDRSEEISLAQAKGLIEETAEMLSAWEDTYDIRISRSFNVTGGEPFLRNDIFEILEEIRMKDFDIYILSNGILVDRKTAEMLSGFGVKGVQVSIEGPEEIHEKIRGKGSFSSALRGVQRLLDTGLTVTMNVTLSELNAGHFTELVNLASSTGVQRLGFSRLVPSGRGLALLDRMLESQKVKETYESIFSLNPDGVEIVTGDPVASQMNASGYENSDNIPSGGCAAGVSGLTILPDGTVTPCRRLPVPIGNVKKDSLREIWVTSPVLEQLRNRDKYRGKCRTCIRWSACRGCRAIAYAYSQAIGEPDFLAEDPQCFIQEP